MMTKRSFSVKARKKAKQAAVLFLAAALICCSHGSKALADEADLKTPEACISKYVEKADGDNDAYDLTLCVSGELETVVNLFKTDIVLVIDTTGSMNNTLTDGTRYWDGITHSVEYLTDYLEDRGIDVRYSMIRFWSYQSNYPPEEPWQDAEIVQDWTEDPEAIIDVLDVLSAQLDMATNYDAAFYTLQNGGLLDSAREDAQKLVFFISDGDPNIYYDENGYDVVDSNYVNGHYPDSEAAAAQRLAMVTGMDGFYSIGVGDNVGLSNLITLTGNAQAPGAGAFQCTSEEQMKSTFIGILEEQLDNGIDNVSLTDTLSGYAVPTADSYITVSAGKMQDGSNLVSAAGENLSDTVILSLPQTETNPEGGTLTASYNAESKTIQASFSAGYRLEPSMEYRVKLRIRPTDAAYSYYQEHEDYPATTGDEGTGATSAGQAGFFSNEEDSAVLTYNDGETLHFPRPVIQVNIIDIPVVKRWIGGEESEWTEVTACLKQGVSVIREAALNSDNDWRGYFTGLRLYDSEGNKIDYNDPEKYSVTESNVPVGYQSDVSGAAEDGFTITNSREMTEATVIKIWDDANNKKGKRPDSLTVTLSNGMQIELNEANGWTATVSGLPKYENGQLITYTWLETLPSGYSLTNTETEGTVTTFTNSYTPEKTSVTVMKVWDDANDQDGVRPARVTVQLYADGEPYGEPVVLTADDWQYTWTELDEVRASKNIVYTVEEVEVPDGYEMTGVIGSADGGYVITNRHEPETIDISGRKTWDDANGQDGLRPTSITIRLLADGEEMRSVTVSPDEYGNWNYEFTGLPKYKAGNEIVYSVTEDPVAGYSSSYDGFNVTNSHVPEVPPVTPPEKADITVTKIWDDANDRDGVRPKSITVNLFADGVRIASVKVEPDAGGNWQYTFTGLEKYDAAGKLIAYTVTEEPVEGYVSSIQGYTITNTHEPDEPDDPGRPDQPEEPYQPGQPDTPDKPDKPGTTGQPDQPGQPDKPNKPGSDRETLPQTGALLWPIMLLTAAGIILTSLGWYMRIRAADRK